MDLKTLMNLEASEYLPQIRLGAMFVGWLLAFYGVRRRDVRGSTIAMAGVGLTLSAIVRGSEDRH
jgi:hypothetical protein